MRGERKALERDIHAEHVRGKRCHAVSQYLGLCTVWRTGGGPIDRSITGPSVSEGGRSSDVLDVVVNPGCLCNQDSYLSWLWKGVEDLAAETVGKPRPTLSRD